MMFQGKMFQGKSLSRLALLQIALSLNVWLIWIDCSPFRRNDPWENKPGWRKIALHVVIANLLEVFNNMENVHQIQKQAHNTMKWPKCYHEFKYMQGAQCFSKNGKIYKKLFRGNAHTSKTYSIKYASHEWKLFPFFKFNQNSLN